jgi:hypothetical protein
MGIMKPSWPFLDKKKTAFGDWSQAVASVSWLLMFHGHLVGVHDPVGPGEEKG